MAFDSDVSEDWRSTVIVPMYKGKKERNECNNYRGISFLSVVEKIYAGILIVRRVTGDLIYDEQGDFREGRGFVDHIFTLKQVGEKIREEKLRVSVGFIGLEKAYDSINMEALW